jgi:type II secretory pathway component PulJ
MPMTPRRRPPCIGLRDAQRGITLVELMIGIAVGMFVVAAASFVLTNQLDDNRRLILETQVQQDLRAVTDIVTRDLRRVGYWGEAEKAVQHHAGAMSDNPYTGIDAAEPGDAGSEVSYAYSLDERQVPAMDENDAVDDHDQAGFRLEGGSLRMRLSGRWQEVTDPATLRITRFDVTLNTQQIDLEPLCSRPRPAGTCAGGTACPPVQQIRQFDVRIDGEAANDPAIQRSMRSSVRVRNDVVTGECPT